MHLVKEVLPDRHVFSLDYMHRNFASSNGLKIDYFSLFNNWLKTTAFDEEFVNQPDKRILSLKNLNFSHH
jgi:hypothetical protein